MAIIRAKNTKEMRRAIEDVMGDAIKLTARNAGELIRAMLKQNIQIWYDSYDPIRYDRLFEVIDAIQVGYIKETRYRYYVEVYLDTTFFTKEHYRILNSEYADTFPHLLEEGWIMPWNGFTREGSHAFSKVKEDIESKDFYSKVVNFLIRHGYDVQWS